MKLIHVRVYPHEKLDVQPNISIEEVSKIKFRERDARDRITEELEKAGLELYKDYIIIVSYGAYTGQGNHKEMEIEVFDL